MSVKYMSAVFDDSSCTSKTERLVLLSIADHCNDQGECFPSIERLAFKSLCTQRAVQKVISRLISAGKMVVFYNQGPHKTNVYKLLIGGANAVHPEPTGSKIGPKTVPKIGPASSPESSGTLRNRNERKEPIPPTPSEEPRVEVVCSNPSQEQYPEIAEEIYGAYPKPSRKPSAMQAIQAALKKTDGSVILEATKRFAAPWKGHDLSKCPSPVVWFSEECFKDDPATWNRPSNQNGSLADLRLKKGALEDRIDHLRAETQYEMHKNHHEMIAEWKQCEKKLEAVNNQIIAA